MLVFSYNIVTGNRTSIVCWLSHPFQDRLDEQEGDLKRLADIVTDLEKELEDEQSKTEDLKVRSQAKVY